MLHLFSKVLLLIIFISHFQSNYSQNLNDLELVSNKNLETTGDFLQHALPISAVLISLIEKDYDGTKEYVFSYTTTVIVTYSLKSTIAKQRPKELKRFDSFPSGHTATGFSGASFIQRKYGSKYGIPAYFLAGIIGISRVKAKHHDYWNVLGGAVVGIGSTYLYSSPNEKPQFEIGFASDNDVYLLTCIYNF